MKKEYTWFKHRGCIVNATTINGVKTWKIDGIDEEFYMPIHAIEYINEVIFGE